MDHEPLFREIATRPGAEPAVAAPFPAGSHCPRPDRDALIARRLAEQPRLARPERFEAASRRHLAGELGIVFA